ncbi:MAG: 50S ribosomal protein L29 [Clostridiales bacterium]|nr:50S ribosomal protein L29 [Clostridiales bacterium]
MKIEKLREMTSVELVAEEKKLKNELFNLRFQHVTGQLDNPIKLRDLKKDIARVKTVIREKELKSVEG